MGESSRRRRALAVGEPWPEDFHVCPTCGSRDTKAVDSPAMALTRVPTLIGVCRACQAFWEAYPADWKHDAVEAEPCDNCAFRKGSPESEDREGWRALLADLRKGREFRCHKGAPMLIDQAATTVEFDSAWIRTKGRSCAGFLRAMQQWADWLDNRYGVSTKAEGGDSVGSQP